MRLVLLYLYRHLTFKSPAMKKILSGIVLLFLPLALLQAQTGKEPDEATSGTTLSETHRFLSGYEGTWTEEWSAPGAEAEKFTFTAVINMILGGRYLQCSQTGEAGNKAFEGLLTLGYDNNTGKFSMIVINTMSTATLVLEGRWKEPGKSILLNGTATHPDDKHTIALRQVITFADKDNFGIESYEGNEQGEYSKNMEYRFSRQ